MGCLGIGEGQEMKNWRKEEGISGLGFRASPCTPLSIFIPHLLNFAAFLSTLPGHPNLTVPIFLHDQWPEKSKALFFFHTKGMDHS